MAKWSQELFADTDGQCQNMLKNDKGEHCCLGILEERTLYMKFVAETNDYGDTQVRDELGSSGYLSPEVAERLNLHTYLTTEEADKLNELSKSAGKQYFFDHFDPRYLALAYLNDYVKLSFREIAVVVVLFGWDVDEDPNFMNKLEKENS